MFSRARRAIVHARFTPPQKPLIAAVEGYALAGGFEVTLVCDLVVAARQKITHDWWRDASAKYDLIVSDVVLREASTGDPQAVQDRLAARKGLPIHYVARGKHLGAIQRDGLRVEAASGTFTVWLVVTPAS